MKRRNFLAGAASAGVLWLAGCSGESVPATTTNDPDQTADTTTTGTMPSVEVSASNTTVGESDVEVRARYRTRVQQAVRPEEGAAATYAEDGQKWLVVQLAVSNKGNAAWQAAPNPFLVEVDGTAHEIVSLDDPEYFGGDSLPPGGSTTGYLVFHVPRSATTATLTYDPDLAANPVAVVFKRDTSLEFSVDK